MKWIGQLIYDQIARFRNDVHLESVSTGTIASGGNIGLDSNNKIVKAALTSHDAVTLAGTPDYITISGQEITRNAIDLANDVTGVLPSANLDADTAHLSGSQSFSGSKSFLANTTNFFSDQADCPQVNIENAHSGASAGRIAFVKDKGAAGADGDDCGQILFMADNSSQDSVSFAKIISEVVTAEATDEAGRLTMQVAVSNGTTTVLRDALTIAGTGTTSLANVNIGFGTSSVTTIEGTLTMGSTAAMTNAGLLSVANQSNITGVGTISSGTWQGDAIATTYTAAKVTSIVAGDGIDVSGATGDVTVTAETATDSNPGVVELATDAEATTGTDTGRAVTPANLKARVSQIINLKGYAVIQDGVYDYANPFNTDDEAPFQLDTSYGSGTIDSSTEVNQSKLFRSGGFHVPFACVVSTIQVQVTCNNAGDVSVAIVEYRPSNAGGDQLDYPRTVYETVVVASADNNNKVTSTTVSGTDLDATAVPAGSHLVMMVKGDGTSAGGTTIISAAIGLSW